MNNNEISATDKCKSAKDNLGLIRDVAEYGVLDPSKGMNILDFAHALVIWQDDNRYLTDEEHFGTLLAWEITHDEEDSIHNLFKT